MNKHEKAILRFCNDPTSRTFSLIDRKHIIKLRAMAEIAFDNKMGNYNLIGKIIRFYALTNIDLSYENALNKLSLENQKILKNQYIKKHKASDFNMEVDHRGLTEFMECLNFDSDFGDEDLCVYNERNFIVEHSDMWKALEIQAIFLGYKPMTEYGLMKNTFVNHWEKSTE